MRISGKISRALIVSMLLPAAVGAQTLRSTGLAAIGAFDPNWQMSYFETNVSPASPFSSAYVLNRTDGGAVSGSYFWIGPTASGSLPGGWGDGFLTRFTYIAKTTFSGITGFSYRCALDDQFKDIGRVAINGVTVSTGCEQYGLGSTYNISGLSTGVNTLEITYGGNGVTDGLLVQIVSTTSTTVPEPTTLGMAASGLLGLITVARRRRHARDV